MFQSEAPAWTSRYGAEALRSQLLLYKDLLAFRLLKGNMGEFEQQPAGPWGEPDSSLP